jgi:Spy/CpxP family protein refolding chaperone
MYSRYTKALTALALAGAVAVPAVAQARGGSDDPPNHQRHEHQVRHHARHDRVDIDRLERRHAQVDNARRGGRSSDDGPNHR